MKTEVMLDTNVLIYALDKSSPFHGRAATLLQDTSLSLRITSKNISEYFCVCSKNKVPALNMWGFYGQLRQHAQVLYPSVSSLAIFESLLQKYQPHGNRIYDMEIVSIALANGVGEIRTANIKDFAGISEIKTVAL
jgi:predicted nucleic acid-binding protein